jgi:HEAT repeat protein
MVLGHIGGGRALATLDRAVAESDPMVREAAAEAMERAAASDVRRLHRMLQSEDKRVRVKAVEALGKLDDLRSLDLLLRAYGDPSTRVNEAVVRVLAQREGERAHSVLIAAAAGGNVSAIHALTEHPVRQGIPALMEALDSPWGEVYGAALEAIRAYVDVFGPEGADDPEAMTALRRAIPELTYLLHDDSAKVRRLALDALSAFRDTGTVREIAYLMLDEKESIRLSAVRILASIGGEGAAAALVTRYEETDDEDLREEIADALEQMGEDEPTVGSPEPV